MSDTPLPPRRSPQPYVLEKPTSPEPPPAPAPTKPSGQSGGKDTGSAQANALSKLGKIGGLGRRGAADGTADGSSTGIVGGQESFEARGSSLAQACLDKAGTFLPIDNFAGVFPMRLDAMARRVTITSAPTMSRGSVPNATRGRIERALSQCPEFQRFMLTQSNLREFNFLITTSSLTSDR